MTLQSPTAVRPKLSMPAAEAEALCSAYAEAQVVLEYGAGGSTLVGAEGAGKTVFSVESDPAWVARLQGWFAANPPGAKVHLHHVDIGPIQSWGQPAGDSHWRNWVSYPFSVWDRPDFIQPDVVLIDGRFRVACFMAVLAGIDRPVTVLFDDYVNRPAYHRVERLVSPVGTIGRMALFEIEPRPLPPQALRWIAESIAQPD